MSALNFGPASPLGAELFNELNERSEVLMSENALLVEQKTTLLTELDNFQKDLSASNNEIIELKKRNNNLSKELQSFQNRTIQAERDREEASQQTFKYSEALGKAEGEIDELRDQLAVWQQKGDLADNNMTEARKQIKAMTTKLEEESYLYMKRTKAAEDRVRELHNQLLQVQYAVFDLD